MSALPMFVRKVRPGEELELWQLFFETVRLVNIRDYSEPQVRVWAPDAVNQEAWCARIARNDPYVCICEDMIVGFADCQQTGTIDQFFVHHAWQRKGVGRHLMTRIESDALLRKVGVLSANVSITAKPFFVAHGFEVIRQQEVTLGDVRFTNFAMLKRLGSVAPDVPRINNE